MRKIYFLIPLIIIILIFSTIGRTQGNISEFQDAEFNFIIRENADYTHQTYDNAMITVRSQEEKGYGILDTGGNGTNGYWISGIEQLYTRDKVKIGELHQGGFSANYESNNSVIIRSFNYSLPVPNNYDNIPKISGVPFSHNTSIYVRTVDNQLVPAIFVIPNMDFFVVEETTWISSFYDFMGSYSNDISDRFNIDSTLSQTGHSITFDISGVIPDIHLYSDHGENLNSSIDYNQIEFNGGFTLGYDSKGIMNEYTVEYEIFYENTKIMDYSINVNRDTGFQKNIKVGGNNNLSSFLTIPVIILAVGFVSFLIQKFFTSDN